MKHKNFLSKQLFIGLLALPFVAKAELDPLKTMEIVAADASKMIYFNAVIESANKATVSSQTSGIISKINYDVGDYVPGGSVIARITSTTQEADLTQAQSAVKEANAKLSQISATISQSQASVREARANYDEANLEYARSQKLYQQRIVPKVQFDRAVAARKSAKARLDAAQAQNTASKANLEVARSSLNASRARLVQAGERLGYTELLAPYSGIVTERHVELGEVVSGGKSVMSGISLVALRALAEVPQSMLQHVSTENAEVLLESGNRLEVNNLTTFPYGDPKTNTFKVRARLQDGVKGLLPGTYVKLGFNKPGGKRISIPESTITQRSEVTAVYVINNTGVPQLTQVKLGERFTNAEGVRMAYILSGLRVGDNIAIDPVHAAIFRKEHAK